MSTDAARALSLREQASIWQGPCGQLDVLTTSPDADAHGVAVVCHPHPLYGGQMRNKVVTTLVKAFDQLGMHTVRFNFRGVGDSEGAYDEGHGECDDAQAVIQTAQRHWPNQEITLAGFSFGGAVAARVAQCVSLKQLVCVAPSVEHFDVSDVQSFDCPVLVLQPGADEVVSAEAVQAWASAITTPCESIVLPGCSHFFHGELLALRDAVLSSLQRQDHGS